MQSNINYLAIQFEKLAKKSAYSAGMLFYCPDDATILLVHRAEHMNNPSLWDVPGGRSKKTDKNIMETAERETKEELKTLPSNKKILTKYVIQKGKSKYHIFIYVISIDTKTKWTSTIELDKENDKYDWFKITKLPQPLRYDLSWLSEAISENGSIKIASDLSKLEYSLPRFEYKFIISETMIPEIQEFLEPYVMPDDHGKNYKINNIYLETPQLNFARNHLSQNERLKLRIRTYNDDRDGFLEIKRKSDGQIIKTRHKFLADEYPEILNNSSNKFVQLMNHYQAEPIMAINYNREAYFLKDDPTVRITFDRQIKYKPTNSIKLGQQGIQTILPNSIIIMEIKFYNKMPQQIKNMIKRFDLKREPMSKYISAIINLIFSDKNELHIHQDLFNIMFDLLHKNKDKRIL